MRKDFAGVQKSLSEAPASLRAAMRSKAIVALGTSIFTGPARQAVGKRTGRLRRTIRFRYNARAGGHYRVQMGSRNLWYGRYLEFGYRKKDGRLYKNQYGRFRLAVYRLRSKFHGRAGRLLGERIARDARVSILRRTT